LKVDARRQAARTLLLDRSAFGARPVGSLAPQGVYAFDTGKPNRWLTEITFRVWVKVPIRALAREKLAAAHWAALLIAARFVQLALADATVATRTTIVGHFVAFFFLISATFFLTHFFAWAVIRSSLRTRD